MSLIAWYPLNGDTKDYSGTGKKDLKIYNDFISNDNGKIGKCFSANSRNAYAQTEDILLDGDQSMCVWFNLSAYASSPTAIVTLHDYTVPANLGINLAGKNVSVSIGYDNDREWNRKGTTIIELNKWYHATITYQKSTNILTLYVNGNIEYKVTLSKKPRFISRPLTLNRWSVYYHDYTTTSKFNDVRLYDETLSAKQVKEISQAKICHYAFNENIQPVKNLCKQYPVKKCSASGYSGTEFGKDDIGDYFIKQSTSYQWDGIYVNIPIQTGKYYTVSYEIWCEKAFDIVYDFNIVCKNISGNDAPRAESANLLGITYDTPKRWKKFAMRSKAKDEAIEPNAYNMMELGLSNSKNITVAHPIASQTACQFAIKNGLNIIRIHLSDYKHDQYTYLTIRPIRRYTAPVAGESVTFSCFNAILLEGDYTNKSIPEYFEGLQSVGEKENNNHRINITSINKNIVLDSAELKNKNNEWVTYNGTITEGYLNNVGYTIKYSGTGAYVDSLQQLIYDRNTNQNKILPDTWYTLSFYAKGNYLTTHVYPSLIDTNVKGFINGTETALRADGYGRHTLTNTWKRITYTFKTKVDLTSLTSNNYLLFRAMPNDNSVVSCIMLEQRKIATEYKPQLVDNRIILLNEPLRGLPNGVKDTIEKINGEWKLIRRCGEIILDGSQDWYGAARVNGLSWAMQLKNKVACKSIGCCDTLPIRNMYYYSNKNISCLSPDNITITLPDSDTTLSASSSESAINNGIKQWLKHNPTKVIYELVVPIIEDIDPITVQCWKNGMIAIDEILPVETTHMVALNKSAQIQKNIEELTMLKNRVETLEEQYNRTALNQAYEVELLKLDMKLDDII